MRAEIGCEKHFAAGRKRERERERGSEAARAKVTFTVIRALHFVPSPPSSSVFNGVVPPNGLKRPPKKQKPETFKPLGSYCGKVHANLFHSSSACCKHLGTLRDFVH